MTHYTSKQEAEQAAREIFRELPPDMFDLVIWENVGWHWKLVLRNIGDFHLHLYYEPDRKTFMAMASHGTPGACDPDYDYAIQDIRYGEDPVELARRVVTACAKEDQLRMSASQKAWSMVRSYR